MKKVWKVKTDLTEEQNRKFVLGMSEEEHLLMTELELDLSVDLIDGETITSFMICDDATIEKIKSLLSKKSISFEVDDTTDFFATDGVALEEMTNEYIYRKVGA